MICKTAGYLEHDDLIGSVYLRGEERTRPEIAVVHIWYTHDLCCGLTASIAGPESSTWLTGGMRGSSPLLGTNLRTLKRLDPRSALLVHKWYTYEAFHGPDLSGGILPTEARRVLVFPVLAAL